MNMRNVRMTYIMKHCSMILALLNFIVHRGTSYDRPNYKRGASVLGFGNWYGKSCQ